MCTVSALLFSFICYYDPEGLSIDMGENSASTVFLDASESVQEEGHGSPDNPFDYQSMETDANAVEGSSPDVWQRFQEDGKINITSDGKRKAYSDPKLVTVPEEQTYSRALCAHYLRGLDKRQEVERDEAMMAKKKGKMAVVEDEEFHTPLLLFDLGKESAPSGVKLHEKGKEVVQSSVLVDKKDDVGSVRVRKARERLSKAAEEVKAFKDKIMNWKKYTRKRKAVSDAVFAVIPDCFLESVELSKTYLEGMYKKLKTDSSDVEPMSAGFRMRIDQEIVESSDSSVGSIMGTRRFAEDDLDQPPSFG